MSEQPPKSDDRKKIEEEREQAKLELKNQVTDFYASEEGKNMTEDQLAEKFGISKEDVVAMHIEMGISKENPEDHEMNKEAAMMKNAEKYTRTEERKVEEEKKVGEIKNELTNIHTKVENAEDVKFINEKLSSIGMKEEDVASVAGWNDLSRAEKLLVIEQSAQEVLTKVKEIGEQRFQEKNKLNLSFNPTKWKASGLNKIKNKMLKSYWISQEEKGAIRDAEAGKIKPDTETVQNLVKRTADMKKGMGIDVVEKNGKAVIEFIESKSEEDKEAVKSFNEIANKYAKMPDAWKNEKAAKGLDTRFSKNWKNNNDKYNEVKEGYESARAQIIESSAKKYESLGIKPEEAKAMAMSDAKESDFKIAMLQFANTNPDAIDELNKIRYEKSWGRLFNNENIWKGIYMSSGWFAKGAATSVFGLIAAPAVSGIVGGIRARRKAEQKINTAFGEGREEETFLERREAGNKGLFDDKNENTGIIKKVFSGTEVNTKKFAAFVDADSQIKRLDNLVQKLESATTDKERIELKSQIEARIGYIEQKHEEGLINYGTKNPIDTNYRLLKLMSEAEADSSFWNGIPNFTKEEMAVMTEDQVKDAEERNRLLNYIVTKNEEKFDAKQASFKNWQMARGAAIGAGFASLGILARHWHDLSSLVHAPTTANLPGSGIWSDKLPEGNGPVKPGIWPDKAPWDVSHGPHPDEHISMNEAHHKIVEVTIDRGHGAIKTFEELKKNLAAEYPDVKNAPASVQHILSTNATKLAQEFKMYDPNQVAESAMIRAGSTMRVDGFGNLIYHNVQTGENNILAGTITRDAHMIQSGEYTGKMFDSDHSGQVAHGTGLHQGGTSDFEKAGTAENLPPVEKGNPVEKVSKFYLDTIKSSPLYENMKGEKVSEMMKNPLFLKEFEKISGMKLEIAQTTGMHIDPQQDETVEHYFNRLTNELNEHSPKVGAVNEGSTEIYGNFHKAFPDNEQIQGMPRSEYDMEVEQYLHNAKGVAWGKLVGDEDDVHWSDASAREADLWKWEKFGQVIRHNAAESADGKIHMGFSGPDNNPAWHATMESHAPASALMDADHASPQYIVGKELVSLREVVHTQTGDVINPNTNESANDYILRLMKHLNHEDKIAPVAGGSNAMPGIEEAHVATGATGETVINNEILRSAPGASSLANDNSHFASYEQLGNRADIIMERPDGTGIHGMDWQNWNNTTDQMLKEHNVAPSDYWKERELQQLFGKAEKLQVVEAGKNVNKISMDYFRDIDSYKQVQNIPAKYFFNPAGPNPNVGPVELGKLLKAGLVVDHVVKIPGQIIPGSKLPVVDEEIHNYAFVNKNELMRLAREYAKIDPANARPIKDETIEQYVSRITKEVHQANDGTFWAKNPHVNMAQGGAGTHSTSADEIIKNPRTNAGHLGNNRLPPMPRSGAGSVGQQATGDQGQNLMPFGQSQETNATGVISPRGRYTGTSGFSSSSPTYMTNGGAYMTSGGYDPLTGQYSGGQYAPQQGANILLQSLLRVLLGGNTGMYNNYGGYNSTMYPTRGTF